MGRKGEGVGGTQKVVQNTLLSGEERKKIGGGGTPCYSSSSSICPDISQVKKKSLLVVQSEKGRTQIPLPHTIFPHFSPPPLEKKYCSRFIQAILAMHSQKLTQESKQCKTSPNRQKIPL